MHILQTVFILLFIFVSGCDLVQPHIPGQPTYDVANTENLTGLGCTNIGGRGALLLSSFNSFEEFKEVVLIEYASDTAGTDPLSYGKPQVRLTHCSNGRTVTSVLKSGISEFHFIEARNGDFWDRAWLGIRSPYVAISRGDLIGVEILARRRYGMFGEGDIAFYDVAEAMVYNIEEEDSKFMSERDLSEKGYLNTFIHITAQAIMTTLFSERLADFIADTHERFHTPELITGVFTDEQIADIKDGPIDNYLDLINNEWGQELGKQLRDKYQITRKTHWTPELLADYFNDIQSYNSWAFQIGIKPFRPEDDLIIRFSHKMNRVLNDIDVLKAHYY